MNPPASEARDRLFCSVLFVVVLGLHAWCSHLGLTNEPLDGHEFRQTQTAISVRYLAQDGLRLDYPTPLLGKPWSIPLEFPLYQGIAALLVRTTGLPVATAARLVGLLFFYLALPALYLLAGRLPLPPHRRLLVLACVLASPLYLFYQRAVLIESTALCLGLWFLWFYWIALADGGWGAGAAALVLGCLAAMVKASTFCAFLTPAAIILVGAAIRRGRSAGGQLLVRAAVLAGGSLIAGIGWTAYADLLKRLNPLSTELLSASVRAWSSGELSLRLSPTFWSTISATTMGTVLGLIGLIVLALFALPAPGGSRRLIGLLLLCFIAPVLVFSNVYLIHDYYFFANGVFLLAALALALDRMLDTPRLPPVIGWAIIALTLGSGFFTYARTYYRLIPNNETRVPELSRALKAVTQPDDVLIIFGQDWNPVLPYTAERRALMVPFPLINNPAAQAASFNQLGSERVGALVVTGQERFRMDLIQPVIRRFGLSPLPVLTGKTTQVYLPAGQVAAAVPVLLGLGLQENTVETHGRSMVVARLPSATAEIFAMMNPRPREVTAQFGLGVIDLEGRHLFGAHPACTLVFDWPAGGRRLHAGFGILPGAYADGAKHTDGVMFEVLLRAADGTQRVLAERLLQPADRAGDRGMQEFDLALPAGATGELILQTGPGPANDFAFDWAYWSFVTLK